MLFKSDFGLVEGEIWKDKRQFDKILCQIYIFHHGASEAENNRPEMPNVILIHKYKINIKYKL